ncbi:prepilin-type N-terminal cleavage/methylation domain-containing protein [Sulfurimonas sp.]|uniref:type II secretion system protein n=1 Tax=Sulfurimonas sp. TaxID=2022749 RepID=UPI002B47667B|nr:prepilin-type N-terminal cleavage/methylation domain-containing protein [Sulfurimonas sp.]
MIIRKAFTMMELVFVIVIMAILAKFGVEFLAQAYNNFIFSKINHELQSNSEYAVEFVSKRLQYRIKDSVIVRNTTLSTMVPLQGASKDVNATVLEWISADEDGFRGDRLPYWSGIIDLDDSNENLLVSKETNTTAVSDLIKILSYGRADINDSAIYFIGSSLTTNAWGYGTPSTSTLITDQNHSMHPIAFVPGQRMHFVPNTGANVFTDILIFEYYKLSWTAYAVELRNYSDTTKSGDLTLWYNYRPWKGERYTDGNKSIIMENVSSFQFRAISSLIKIQVCVKSLLTNEEYSICKEKTIF